MAIEDAEIIRLEGRKGAPSMEASETRAPEFSEEALALEFAERHAGRLAWVQAQGRWRRYEGGRWSPDETLRAFDQAREICREAAARCNKLSHATALTAAKTVAAVERLARSDQRLAASVDQWDADPWLLNTPDGVVDLKTGRLRPHDPFDYLTKTTSVAPGGECPLWHQVLDRATGGDVDLKRFLHLLFGYALTGDISVQALYFAHGPGANSKSLIINTVSEIFGDYHRTAPIETFTASGVDRHPTELAGLQGARLVTATETEDGRRWAESRIKALTGGERISARFMRQDFFEFTPQFKLLIAGNHKPGLRSVDQAIRRRFRLIPFSVTIPVEERDEQLMAKLRAEHGGILAWMIEGCLR
jgi:putative DNA primase/helicase